MRRRGLVWTAHVIAPTVVTPDVSTVDEFRKLGGGVVVGTADRDYFCPHRCHQVHGDRVVVASGSLVGVVNVECDVGSVKQA